MSPCARLAAIDSSSISLRRCFDCVSDVAVSLDGDRKRGAAASQQRNFLPSDGSNPSNRASLDTTKRSERTLSRRSHHSMPSLDPWRCHRSYSFVVLAGSGSFDSS